MGKSQVQNFEIPRVLLYIYDVVLENYMNNQKHYFHILVLISDFFTLTHLKISF